MNLRRCWQILFFVIVVICVILWVDWEVLKVKIYSLLEPIFALALLYFAVKIMFKR